MRKKKWELNRSSNDCDGFSTANAGFQHASTIRLRLLLAMKMLLLTQKKGFESEQKGMRTNTPEGFDLEEKSVGACWRLQNPLRRKRIVPNLRIPKDGR
jgi:hypothetical protein